AGRKQALVVIGELHETDTEAVPNFNERQIVLDRRRILETEDHRGAAVLLCAAYIIGRIRRADQVGEIPKPPIPLADIGDRLAEILMIADRDVDRRDTARVQLPENLLRPVAVLQAVDEEAIGRVHTSCSGVPALM